MRSLQLEVGLLHGTMSPRDDRTRIVEDAVEQLVEVARSPSRANHRDAADSAVADPSGRKLPTAVQSRQMRRHRQASQRSASRLAHSCRDALSCRVSTASVDRTSRLESQERQSDSSMLSEPSSDGPPANVRPTSTECRSRQSVTRPSPTARAQPPPAARTPRTARTAPWTAARSSPRSARRRPRPRPPRRTDPASARSPRP